MSNAPSLKEPSMEEILASIRRIIESGDERTKPQGDILHDDPSSTDTDGLGDDPVWDFGTPPRDFAPANADAPPASPAATAEDAGASVVEAHAATAAAIDPPAGVFVAEVPEEAALAEPVVVDQPALVIPRVPRREAMPRRADVPREGLSLSGAYRRDIAETDDVPPAPTETAEPAATVESRHDAPVAEAEAIEPTAELAPDPVAGEPAAVAGGTAGLADRIAETVSADFATAFDEEQFSSDLRIAVGLEQSVPEETTVEPSVITAASSLMSEAAGAQVAAAFDDLARAIRDGQMKSMEDMAREMLRPMLQEWLDDNLPRIVERMVREEIERVSRGPRR